MFLLSNEREEECDVKLLPFSVETVRQSRPEIVDLLKPLQANATRLIGVGESLDVNVKALKEKIELAREQANRVSTFLYNFRSNIIIVFCVQMDYSAERLVPSVK